MFNLCACSHKNDHPGKPCPVPGCACQFGTRIDVAVAQMLAEQSQALFTISMTLMRILAILEAQTGLETGVVSAGGGRSRVELRQKKASGPPLIVVPGMGGPL